MHWAALTRAQCQTNQGVTMIRTLRILGVAFVAVLAFSAVAATTASAEGKITCTGGYPCTLTGESALGNDTFTTEAGNVECKAHFDATLPEAVSNLTVTPKYTNCRAFGFLEATVHMNGCAYEFTTATRIGTSADLQTHEWTTGTNSTTLPASEVTHLECPMGAKVEITAATCRVQIHPQTLHGHLIITSTTAPTPDDIDVKGKYTGIDYTVTQDGFGCPFAGTGPKDGAIYEQHEEITIRADNGAKGVHLG
jgi:hypothetical protein